MASQRTRAVLKSTDLVFPPVEDMRYRIRTERYKPEKAGDRMTSAISLIYGGVNKQVHESTESERRAVSAGSHRTLTETTDSHSVIYMYIPFKSTWC
jgi:hypothetical protein